jgi:hypothetical protein
MRRMEKNKVTDINVVRCQKLFEMIKEIAEHPFEFFATLNYLRKTNPALHGEVVHGLKETVEFVQEVLEEG